MNELPYAIEYMRTTIEQRGNEQEGVMLWLAEIYQAIEELRLDDIQQLIRSAKTFRMSPWGKAQIFLGRGDFHARLQDWNSAIDMYQRGLDCLKDIEKAESDRALLLNNLGLIYQEQARYEDAISSYEQAIQLYDRANDLMGKIHATSNLASAYDARGEWENAIQYYKQGIQDLEAATDKADLASFWNNLGVAYQNSGNQQSARDAFQRCLEILNEAGEAHSERGARILMNLGEIYAELKEDSRAVEFFQNAVEICREIGDTSMEISVWNNLGAFYAKSGDGPKAIKCYETCLNLAVRIDERATEVLVLNNLGSAYEDAAEYEKAHRAYMQSLDLAEEQQELYGIARAYNNLGVLYEKQGMLEEALFHYTEAAQALNAIGDYYREVVTIINIATLQARLQNIESSQEWMKRGISISEERGFVDHLAFLAILEGDIEFTRRDRFSEACDAYARACGFAYHPNAKSLSEIMEIVLKRADTLDIPGRKAFCRHLLDSCGAVLVSVSTEFHQKLVLLTEDH